MSPPSFSSPPLPLLLHLTSTAQVHDMYIMYGLHEVSRNAPATAHSGTAAQLASGVAHSRHATGDLGRHQRRRSLRRTTQGLPPNGTPDGMAGCRFPGLQILGRSSQPSLTARQSPPPRTGPAVRAHTKGVDACPRPAYTMRCNFLNFGAH